MLDCFWCEQTMYQVTLNVDGVLYTVNKCSHCGSWSSNMIATPNALQHEVKSGK